MSLVSSVIARAVIAKIYANGGSVALRRTLTDVKRGNDEGSHEMSIALRPCNANYQSIRTDKHWQRSRSSRADVPSYCCSTSHLATMVDSHLPIRARCMRIWRVQKVIFWTEQTI